MADFIAFVTFSGMDTNNITTFITPIFFFLGFQKFVYTIFLNEFEIIDHTHFIFLPVILIELL